jgi:hypothetical protein
MTQTFSFTFDRRFAPLLLLWGGVTPQRAQVTVDDDQLHVQFGVFSLTTARSNIASAQVTGPHKPIKAIGIRTSLSDRGLTFGSAVDRTTCIEFHEPVRAQPLDIASHPGLTVSVDRPDELAALLNS